MPLFSLFNFEPTVYEIEYPTDRNAPKSVFSRFVLFPDYDIIVLSQFDQDLLAEADGRKIGKRIAQIPGQGCLRQLSYYIMMVLYHCIHRSEW